MVLLCQIANVVAMRIHDDISIQLLEAHEDVHHLKLPLNNERRVVEESHDGMGFFENAMRVFWYVYGRNEAVFAVRRSCECVRHGFDFGGFGGGLFGIIRWWRSARLPR
jgi:hypothetical protein